MDFGTPISLHGGLPRSVVHVMDVENEIDRLTRLQRAVAAALANLKKQLPAGSRRKSGGGGGKSKVRRKHDGTFDIVNDDEFDDEEDDSVGILSDSASR